MPPPTSVSLSDKNGVAPTRMALHSSSYFENAMSTCWVEESSRHLVIDGVQPDVGRAIVGFLYGQDLEVPQSQLLSTLVAVDRLMLTELEDVCCEHIQSLLSPESALELAAGIAEGCPSMHRSWLAVCSAYIEANEDAIRKTDAFKSISRDQIITMISVRGPPIFLSPVPYVMHWLKAQNEGVRGCASMVGQEQEGGDEEGEGGEDDPSVLVEEAKLVFRAFELLATVRIVRDKPTTADRPHSECHSATATKNCSTLRGCPFL